MRGSIYKGTGTSNGAEPLLPHIFVQLQGREGETLHCFVEQWGWGCGVEKRHNFGIYYTTQHINIITYKVHPFPCSLSPTFGRGEIYELEGEGPEETPFLSLPLQFYNLPNKGNILFISLFIYFLPNEDHIRKNFQIYRKVKGRKLESFHVCL